MVRFAIEWHVRWKNGAFGYVVGYGKDLREVGEDVGRTRDADRLANVDGQRVFHGPEYPHGLPMPSKINIGRLRSQSAHAQNAEPSELMSCLPYYRDIAVIANWVVARSDAAM